MKNKIGGKALTVIIAILSVVVLVLLGILFYQIVTTPNAAEKKENATTTASTTAAVTETVTTEAKTENTTEKTTSDSDEKKEEKNDSKNDSDKKKEDRTVVVSDGGGWPSGSEYVRQFNVVVNNTSNENLENWEVQFAVVDKVKVLEGWNADYSIKENVLSAVSKDYNNVIQSKGSVDFGVQLSFPDEKTAKEAELKGTLYINGEKYEASGSDKSSDKTEEVKKEEKKDKLPAEEGTPVANHGKLVVKGTDIYDANGKPYQLKGASTHGLQWFPEYVSKETFTTIRDDWGANMIRLALYTDENGYCSGGNKEKLKSLVEDGVQYATELGMYVIIDWHILHDLTPKKYQSEAEAFFDEMSFLYADYDNVLYEICNEPNGGTEWSEVKEYAEDIIPIIRKNDKDAIIIVGTPNWSQFVDEAAKDPIKGQKNIMYTLHFYAATHKDDLRSKLRNAIDSGLPVFITEFSICDASGNGGIDYESADEWKKLIREYNLSYAEWSICNKAETAALIAPGNDKKSGWSDDELSDTGRWLKEFMQEN